ncbi:hypothetical protein [Halopiger aswanensis]|uniref:CopG family transcriptional regulator n=1 Tax=Halopiger aswanensis TaxID=148449 RepID=A0A3R7KN44_9EURY|nr:hypothetical protein [Halopiger aswanensis]RKD97673.1 hypothetical protein ATJ93_0664 [Halopiger aswanensis]
MESEDDEGDVSFALPADVDDWVTDAAADRDESPADVCRRVVAAAHAVATEGEGAEPADREDLEELRGELEAQREEFRDLLEDVRSRVIQVKRETDAKAPAEHDHDEYEADLSSLRADLEDLEATVDAGFENFEEVLEYLLERTDRLEERSTVLAKAAVDLRDHWDAFAERERRRAAADRLKTAANRLGIRTATCEDCGSSVDVALLTAPECPHCASPIADVAAKQSFFGSPTLETGEPPALEGRAERATESTAEDVFAQIESNAETAAETERDRTLPFDTDS